MSKEEFKEYLDSVVERAFKAGFKYGRDLSRFGDLCILADEAIKNAKEEILE